MLASRSLLRDLTVTPFTVAITTLLEPVHRRSLANARDAILARREEDLAGVAALGQLRRRAAS